MKQPLLTYDILIERDAGSWEVLDSIRSRGALPHVHKLALRKLRESWPSTVHGTPTDWRLVIVPHGRVGRTHTYGETEE